jgi:hypothetical protein
LLAPADQVCHVEALHRRLLQIGFDAGDDLGLVLAGGYALAAHELVQRPSRDEQ